VDLFGHGDSIAESGQELLERIRATYPLAERRPIAGEVVEDGPEALKGSRFRMRSKRCCVVSGAVVTEDFNISSCGQAKRRADCAD
jgi:hypothetical protein